MTTTILTDDQIENEFIEHGWSFGGKADMYVEVARAVEQAVLQSPEVQAWRKDAERYRWWCDTGNDISSGDTFGGKTTIDAAIDAAMEKQP